MKPGLRILIVAMITSVGVPALAQAPPSYLILRTPQHATSVVPHTPGGYSPPRGYAIPVQRPTYAYGWFGAAPRQHWSRHTGYYRNYTQWSAR